MSEQDAVGGTPVEEAGIPLDELERSYDPENDGVAEFADDLLESMRRLSTDEERRREIGKMLV